MKFSNTLFMMAICAILSTTCNDASASVALEGEEFLYLWPDAAPGSENVTFKEEIIERSEDPSRPDRIVVHTTNPILVVHRPENPNGVAVIIAPGGGYSRVVVDKEGPDTSRWLNSLGVTTFVLRYRFPGDPHKHAEDVPLQDAQRAVRLVRSMADEWGFDAHRIGFAGYSAGGHLAMSITAFHDKKIYAPVDEVDAVSARPDFSILGYPFAGREGVMPQDLEKRDTRALLGWKYRIEAPFSADCPPAFIFHAEDDPSVGPEHSHRIARTLRTRGSSVELHIFKSGGHGFGIRDAVGPVQMWPALCEAWMQEIGML